jgi:hypothetical protein
MVFSTNGFMIPIVDSWLIVFLRAQTMFFILIRSGFVGFADLIFEPVALWHLLLDGRAMAIEVSWIVDCWKGGIGADLAARWV